MELAEQLDPEDCTGSWTASSRSSPRRASLRGDVNQYTGDGIMALFGARSRTRPRPARLLGGAPSPRRGAALCDELRTARGFNFAVRMGSTRARSWWAGSARPPHGLHGTRAHGGARAADGAARRAGQAAAHRTHAKLVTGSSACGSRTLPGEGHDRADTALRARGRRPARTRFDVSRARGLSRFVGRAPEMAALEASLERALAARARSSASSAEPGVGKSRLCHEFAERCRARASRSSKAHAVGARETIPLLPGWSSCGTPSRHGAGRR